MIDSPCKILPQRISQHSPLVSPSSSPVMEAESPIERRPASQFSQTQSLPSIAQLTSNMTQPEIPAVLSRPHSDIRDSGNWSISQSKRECWFGSFGDTGRNFPVVSQTVAD